MLTVGNSQQCKGNRTLVQEMTRCPGEEVCRVTAAPRRAFYFLPTSQEMAFNSNVYVICLAYTRSITVILKVFGSEVA